MKNNTEQKKVWETPSVTVYGDMNSLTQQKSKQAGSRDDFMVQGISNA